MLFLFLQLNSFGQIGKEFWFAAPDAAAEHGDSPIYLRLSAMDKNANITISQPANPQFSTIKKYIPAEKTATVTLSGIKNQIENQPADQVLKKGIFVQSDAPIVAYYEIGNSNNPEIYSLKGNNALGKHFFVPSQNEFHNAVGTEMVEIVATEPHTTITIKPTAQIKGHAAGSTFSIILDKGQSYSIHASQTDASISLAGTEIVSDKPIAITISDDSIKSDSAYDIIGDQLVPVDLLGTEHIVVKGYANKEIIYLLAVEDNTSLFSDGQPSPITTLNKGDSYALTLNKNSIYLQSSKPIYTYHLSGYGNEYGAALIPHLDCTGSDIINFVRSAQDEFMMMILVETKNTGKFTIDGKSTIIKASDFRTVAGTNGKWSYTRKEMSINEISVNSHKIKNAGGLFHLGILNNFLGASSEYGFFSAYSTLNLGNDIKACIGEEVLLDAGYGNDEYSWSTGAKSRELRVTSPGQYSVTVIRGSCKITDEVQVSFFDPPTVNLGEDITSCTKAHITIDAGKDKLSYLWPDGSSQQTFEVSAEGEYWVKVEAECAAATDTIHVFYIDPPGQMLDEKYENCYYDSVFLSIKMPDILTFYQWSDGKTDAERWISQPGNYWYEIKNVCGKIQGEFEIKQVEAPSVDLGEDIEKCNKTPLTLDAGAGDFTFLWNDTEGENTFTVEESGKYTIEKINGCATARDTIEILMDSAPKIENVTIENRNDVYLEVSGGIEPLSYSRGNSNFSQSPKFWDVPPGTYIFKVQGANGCNAQTEPITIIEYPVNIPRYFSPNSDGINDQWVLNGIDAYPKATVRIFDRYGHILSEFNGTQTYWDGFLNGKPLPSDDYWYIIDLEGERIISGHISIIR